MTKLIKKFKKSAKIVEENQSKFRQEMELRNEKRRLRVNDLNYERERMKQLQQAKKEQIIKKEIKDKEMVIDR